MVQETHDFLEPFASTSEQKKDIDFHNVPDALPEEPKMDTPIDPNPLALDDYAISTFNLNLPE
jgi:hypothetical protein